MIAQLLDKLEAPPDKPFNSLTRDQLSRLEALFQQEQNIKALQSTGVAAGVFVVGSAVLGFGGGVYAAPGGGAANNAAANAKTSIENGVTNAIDMIKAIDGIGLAAFGVALAPMGFMTTLRVLNMVLSRV